MTNDKDHGAELAAVVNDTTAETPPERQAHTPGPWRWEVNLKSKEIQLCGGRPRFDLTVMDFVRWGMGGAAPRLLRPMRGSTLMLLEHASHYAEGVPGREHHSEWFQTLHHPDAHLIAAAPDLLAAVKSVVDWFDAIKREQDERTMPPVTFAEAAKNWELPTEVDFFDIAPLQAALAKAEGR